MRIIIIIGEPESAGAMMSAIMERPVFRAPSPSQGPVRASTDHEVDSRRLLQGRAEILIRHGGEVYRLRHTRNDKLILTK